VAFGFVTFDFVALGLAIFRALARGFAVRRSGFLMDFFGFVARRLETVFLPAAFGLARFLPAAFAFAGRALR
jgi:K+-transporting ATPase A subunit